MVRRSSHWNQEATSHHAFSAVTLLRLLLWLHFPFNCRKSYSLVPIWWFLAWGSLMQCSWTGPHKSVHRLRFPSHARPANSTFAPGVRSDSVEKPTVHNSLVDCHSEVWTRYPAQAAIRREIARSITFISPNLPDNPSKYFKALVREFEQKTRKQTRHQLADIGMAVQPSFGPVSPNIPTCQFKAGDRLVGLFCPIPTHIAVAGQTPSSHFAMLSYRKDLSNRSLGQTSVALQKLMYYGICHLHRFSSIQI